MAAGNARTPAELRQEIETERERLAEAVESLRGEMHLGTKLRGKLPLLAIGAVGAGFVVAGGVGATMRLLARRGREGRQRARVGRFAVVDRN